MTAIETLPATNGIPPAPELRLIERPPTIDELLEQRRKPLSTGWLLDFGAEPGIDIYNSSAPIKCDDGNEVVIVREEKGYEFTSQNRFFRSNRDNSFRHEPHISNLSTLSMGTINQDPSSAYVQGKWVITQVEVDPKTIGDDQETQFQSGVYAGDRLDNLRLIARTPKGKKIKGVRLIELKDHRVMVLVRPQTDDPETGGAGKIACAIVDSVEDVNEEVLANAALIPDLASGDPTEWEGANDAILLPNGDLAVLEHKARFEEGSVPNNRAYYSSFFTLNPYSLKVDNLQILATATDFELHEQVPGKLNRPDLDGVFYPSFLGFADGDITVPEVILTGGFRDSRLVSIIIPNPLDGWLKAHPEYAMSPFVRSPQQVALQQAIAV